MENIVAFPNIKTRVYSAARLLAPNTLHALAYVHDRFGQGAASMQLETGETVSLDDFLCDVSVALGSAGNDPAPVAERMGFTLDRITAIQLGLGGQAPLPEKAG